MRQVQKNDLKSTRATKAPFLLVQTELESVRLWRRLSRSREIELGMKCTPLIRVCRATAFSSTLELFHNVCETTHRSVSYKTRASLSETFCGTNVWKSDVSPHALQVVLIWQVNYSQTIGINDLKYFSFTEWHFSKLHSSVIMHMHMKWICECSSKVLRDSWLWTDSKQVEAAGNMTSPNRV